MSKPLKPAAILDATIETGVGKGNSSAGRLILLGILAGSFIALAASGSTMAAFNLLGNPETYGIGKLVAGAVFPTGLMLVVLAGGELFTGNTLMFAGVLEKKITIAKMIRNLIIVYGANFVGAMAIATAVYYGGTLGAGAGHLGAVTIKIAAGKTSLGLGQGFVLGILCNWLVCLAVWLAYGSEQMVGKIAGIFFPVSLFVTLGFEHSIANMYYIPAGILAKANEQWVELAGLSKEALDGLCWQGFFIDNLIPVTLGNIVGGAIMVAGFYFLAYKKFK